MSIEGVSFAEGWKTGRRTVKLPESFENPRISPELAAEMVEQVRQSVPRLLAHADADLEPHSEKNGVSVCSGIEEGSDLRLVRGITENHCPIDVAPASFSMGATEAFTKQMRNADEMLLDCRTLAILQGRPAITDQFGNTLAQPVLPYCALRWSSFNTPFPIWSRDFVFLQYTDWVVHNGQRMVVAAAMSVEHPDTPSLEASHKFVRANIMESGYIVAPVEGTTERTRWIYSVRVDAGGAIPVWVQNLVAPKQAYNVGRAGILIRSTALGAEALARHSITHPSLVGPAAMTQTRRVGMRGTLSIPVSQLTASSSTINFVVMLLSGSSVRVSFTGGVTGTDWAAGKNRTLEAGAVLEGSVGVTSTSEPIELQFYNSAFSAVVLTFRLSVTNADGAVVTWPVDPPLLAPHAAVGDAAPEDVTVAIKSAAAGDGADAGDGAGAGAGVGVDVSLDAAPSSVVATPATTPVDSTVSDTTQSA